MVESDTGISSHDEGEGESLMKTLSLGPRFLLRRQEPELCCLPATITKPISSSKWQPSSAKIPRRWTKPWVKRRN